MAILRTLAVSCALLAGADALAKDAQIDFVSADGPDRTCPQFRDAQPGKLRGDADRVAFAICNAIDMVREVATRFRSFQSQDKKPDNSFVDELRKRLERVQARIRASRIALEGVKGAGPFFAIRPGEWAIDWDGDGTISVTEKYLLWVPKRGVDAFRAQARFASEAAYHEEQFVSPRIKVDQSDIYWAIAYCQFAEVMLNLVLSYEVNLGQGFEVRLKDAARISKVAYRNVLEGIRASGKLRESLLKETDDDDEWIPSPRQVKTSFPLLMDPQTFTTWAQLLGHMEKLFRGKTLLGGAVSSQEFGNVRDLAGGICRPSEGIDVKSLFTNPIRLPLSEEGLKSRCVMPTPARPMTGLAKMIAESARRNAGRTPESFSGEWMILRHFYWVN